MTDADGRGRARHRIQLGDSERQELERVARAEKLPSQDVQRARIVFHAAAGVPDTEIASRLDTSAGMLVFSKETPDLFAGIAGCLQRLGGLPDALVWDRQARLRNARRDPSPMVHISTGGRFSTGLDTTVLRRPAAPAPLC
jgi:hypothetical protein